MAKTNMVEREKRRARTEQKYAAKRAELKEIIRSPKSSPEARADAQAIVHAHPPHATALACLPRIHASGIPAFHYMIAAAGGHDIRCAPYATYGTAELSRHAQAALRDRRACLLAQHGTVALGAGLASALELAVEVEALARMYWLALQVGEPVILDTPQMDEVLARFARYRPDDG